MARLEPALRPQPRAASRTENWALSILCSRFLDRLDKYGAVVDIVNKDHEGAHERLMTLSTRPPSGYWDRFRPTGARTAARRGRPEPPTAAKLKRPPRPKIWKPTP